MPGQVKLAEFDLLTQAQPHESIINMKWEVMGGGVRKR